MSPGTEPGEPECEAEDHPSRPEEELQSGESTGRRAAGRVAGAGVLPGGGGGFSWEVWGVQGSARLVKVQGSTGGVQLQGSPGRFQGIRGSTVGFRFVVLGLKLELNSARVCAYSLE